MKAAIASAVSTPPKSPACHSSSTSAKKSRSGASNVPCVSESIPIRFKADLPSAFCDKIDYLCKGNSFSHAKPTSRSRNACVPGRWTNTSVRSIWSVRTAFSDAFSETGNVPSFILWGPPGVGKTTLARLVATALDRKMFTLSAINAGVKDVREVIEQARKNRFFNTPAPFLFIDEIHRFNKSQQDSLLGAVEQGIVTLVGATTENPSFEVISPLLSRCQVYVLKAMEESDLQKLLDRAIATDTVLQERKVRVEQTAALFRFSGGDARKLLNIIDILSNATEGEIVISDRSITECLQQNIALYDKNGEQHYDVISAFIKSVRGSDPNAAIYYLARMLAGGEDPKFIARRLVILASEDIGLANPNGLLLANACFDTVHKIGMPEARITLAETTIYLATSPKSNSAYMAIDAALAQVRHRHDEPPGPAAYPQCAHIADERAGLRRKLPVCA